MNNLHVVSHGTRGQNRIALTFDDGPNPHFTSDILDILTHYSVKANFFVLGKRCQNHPQLLKKIYECGHLIGNHTFSHSIGDFKRCEKVINNIIGVSCDYLRPPFCNISKCKRDIDYCQKRMVVTGDVNSKDYRLISTADVIDNVIKQVAGGSIITMHDGSERDENLDSRALKTTEALPSVIEHLLGRGCRFVRLDNMRLKPKILKPQPE
jgi:peptidoglycan/xylan/chitin deacetylase (PgdA/CDA1 family)